MRVGEERGKKRIEERERNNWSCKEKEIEEREGIRFFFFFLITL